MRFNTTAVLVLAMIGLGAYLSLYEIRQPPPEEREQLSKVIVTLAPEQATQLALDLPTAQATLTRHDGLWRLSPQGFRADEGLISKILIRLNPLMAERTLAASTRCSSIASR